jgi:acyl-CoA thioester hydrolase
MDDGHPMMDQPNAIEARVGETRVCVRYPECDPAGMAHHSVFAVWMELARGDLLRKEGCDYRQLTERGVYFVVARMSVRYRHPVRYDDHILVRTWIERSGRGKVDHAYEMRCDGRLVATAQTTLVCVDAAGRPRPIPQGVMSSAPVV